jgi:N4-gp56 family major capsid protein
VANETTSTEVAEFAEKVLDEARFVAQAQSLFMPGKPGEPFLRLRDLTGRKAKSADFPKWNELTASAQGETDDVSTWQQADASATTITATIKTVPTFWTDMAIDCADEDLVADRGEQMGRAFAKKVDTDICALLDGFTTKVGSTGVDLAFASILSAINTLERNEAPRPYAVILHPQQWYDLLIESNSKFLEVSQFGPVAEEVVSTYRVFEALGCLWLITPRCEAINSGADVSGVVMAKGALGFVWKWLPRIDTQRDESRGGGGYEVIGKLAYGVAELEDTYGVNIVSDAP